MMRRRLVLAALLAFTTSSLTQRKVGEEVVTLVPWALTLSAERP